jgi:hypothetical protein
MPRTNSRSRGGGRRPDTIGWSCNLEVLPAHSIFRHLAMHVTYEYVVKSRSKHSKMTTTSDLAQNRIFLFLFLFFSTSRMTCWRPATGQLFPSNSSPALPGLPFLPAFLGLQFLPSDTGAPCWPSNFALIFTFTSILLLIFSPILLFFLSVMNNHAARPVCWCTYCGCFL